MILDKIHSPEDVGRLDGDLLPEDHPARLSAARVLTVYAGPPCAGKSELGRGAGHGELIDVDDLLAELGGYYSASASRQAHALALQDLDDAIQRGTPSIGVVAPLLSERMRDEYAERAAAAGYTSRLLYVTAALPVLEGRNRRRSSRRLRMASLRACVSVKPAPSTGCCCGSGEAPSMNLSISPSSSLPMWVVKGLGGAAGTWPLRN